MYVIKCIIVHNLFKGFCLFHFANIDQAQRVLTKGPWIVMHSLLVMQPYTRDLPVNEVHVWVEFSNLLVPC